MKKLFTIILTLGLLSVLLIRQPSTVLAADIRALKLATYLFKHNSSLGYLAPVFVQEADNNRLDYRLLPAISGVESTFGQNYLAGTYNVYGWGAGIVPFASWEDGITKVSVSLRENYVEKGATTIEKISWIYCPPGNLNWAAKVRYFMDEIEKTEISKHQVPQVPEELALPPLRLTYIIAV